MQLFAVEEEAIHHVGDAQCPECLEEYPETCARGGLIHAESGGPDDEDGNPGRSGRGATSAGVRRRMSRRTSAASPPSDATPGADLVDPRLSITSPDARKA